MRMRIITLLAALLTFTASFAQPKWDLRKSVEYALKNNISVRQADVQAKIAALTYEESRLSQFPSANIQNSGGYQFGRSIDPANNQFTTDKLFVVSHSLNVGVDL